MYNIWQKLAIAIFLSYMHLYIKCVFCITVYLQTDENQYLIHVNKDEFIARYLIPEEVASLWQHVMNTYACFL